MSWLGAWLGGSTGGGGGTPAWPPIAVGGSTTAESIRDRMVAVITALVPKRPAADRFRAHRSERDGDFLEWLEANPAACQRRFQVRDVGDLTQPKVTNTDVEWRELTFRVLVAYPQTHRAGAQNALDRDDMIDNDRAQIEAAIGVAGGANFAAPYPNACHISTRVAREGGVGFDVLSVEQRMGFYRSV